MYSNGYDQSALRTYTGDIRHWCSRLYVRRHRNITPTYWTATNWPRTRPWYHRYITVLFLYKPPHKSSKSSKAIFNGLSGNIPLLSRTYSLRWLNNRFSVVPLV